MCRPDGRHVLNNQGTDDYVLTLQLHRLSDMITARERRLSSFNKEKNNAEMYIHLRIHISAFCLRL